MGQGQAAHQAVLGGIRVLKLVDQNVLEVFLVAGQALGMFVKQPHHEQQQIVEIHRVIGCQQFLIACVHPRRVALPGRRVAEGLGAEHVVLGFGDGREHRRGAVLLIVDRQVVEGQAHHPLLVVLVVDDVVAGQAERRAILPQPARAQRVKRAGGEQPQPGALQAGVDRSRKQSLRARTHLARGLVGKGDRQDARRVQAGLEHEVDQAIRQHARLAGARPGDNQHRARAGGDSLPLLGVEFVE